MAISRSLMNRQLQANGGIMQVAPREKFGLGSKLKSFVRKIIPNEIADIAVKAAPFVAPFNPAVGAAMSGLGRFDQTGSIGDSLKGGALTYGLGQGARYLGGAGFQGNPFAADGGAFRGGFEGFTQGFSSPLGTDTGLGKFFSNRGTPEVQGIDTATGGADGVGVIQDAPTKALASELSYVPEASIDMVTGGADGVGIIPNTIANKSTVANQPGFLKNLFDGISNQDYGKVGNTILDGAKKFGKAMFTNKDGSIDKAAVLGAATFAASYAEAKALANDAGVEITEEVYDEAKKADKKEEYAGYLTNFFGGQKDGGRIGYELGANKYITKRERQDPMAGLGLLGGLDPTIDESDQKIIVIMTENGPQTMTESEFNKQMGIDNETGPIIIDMQDFLKDKNMKKDGGRIGFKKGSPEEPSEVGIMAIDVEAGDDDEGEEDMMMAYEPGSFTSAQKSYMFRRLAAMGGKDRSITMPDLYKIFKNPGKYPADELVIKSILDANGLKDGGRIGYKGGANRVSELLILRDEKIGKGEDVSDIEAEIFQLTGKTFKSVGGISDVPTGQIRKNNAGVVERDYRDEGGFVPVGIKERADDVPAMLSKNEFVMTADAVRGIGNGSVEEGSKKLYNTMKQAEKVGKA